MPGERLAYLLATGEATVAMTQSYVADRVSWPEGVERSGIAVKLSEPRFHHRAHPRIDGCRGIVIEVGRCHRTDDSIAGFRHRVCNAVAFRRACQRQSGPSPAAGLGFVHETTTT